MTKTQPTLQFCLRKTFFGDLFLFSLSFLGFVSILIANTEIWTQGWDVYGLPIRAISFIGFLFSLFFTTFYLRHFFRMQGVLFTPVTFTLERDYIHLDRHLRLFGSTSISRTSISKLKATEIHGTRRLELSINGRAVHMNALCFEHFDHDLLALYRWIVDDPLAVPDAWGSSIRIIRIQAGKLSLLLFVSLFFQITAPLTHVHLPHYFYLLILGLVVATGHYVSLFWLLPKNPTHWLVAHRGTRLDIEAERKRVAALKS